jgi:hypothetical protein
MSGHAFQARSEAAAAPASVRNASAKATPVTAHSTVGAAGLDDLHAALNGAAKVRQAMQLRRSLNQSPPSAELARVAHKAQRVPPGRIVQRLELTDGMWTHIARGELREGNKKLVGYHWTGDDKAIAVKNGTSQQGPNKLGVYVEGVQTIESFGKGKKAPITKGTPSTFWPDAWSEGEIKDAIAHGGRPAHNVSEVSTKATKTEAQGMKLFVNPDSVFPVYEADKETESGGGRRRGGGRKR